MTLTGHFREIFVTAMKYEIWTLFEFYAASISSFVPTFRDNPSGPIFNVQADSLSSEDGTDRLSLNVGNWPPNYAA